MDMAHRLAVGEKAADAGRAVLLPQGGGIDRHVTTVDRGDLDLRSGISEGVIGRCQLFHPDTGFVAGVAHLGVRGEDNQDFQSKLACRHGDTSPFIHAGR